jgi:hypothetical protein
MPSSITSSYGIDPFVTATNSTSPFERNLYNRYEYINLTVHDILEEALGILFDVDKIMDKKLKDHDFVKKFQCMENNHKSTFKLGPMESDDGSFKLKTLISRMYEYDVTINPYADLYSIYNEQMRLFNESLRTKQGYDELISIRAGACTNDFPIDKKSPVGATTAYNQYTFRVVPYFKSPNDNKLINNGTLKNIDLNAYVAYTVTLDMPRLLNTILNIYDPSNLPDKYKNNNVDKDRDAYIRTGLNIFRALPETICKDIILEIYTNFTNVKHGWEHFIKQRELVQDKFSKSDSVSMTIRKATHNYIAVDPNYEFDIDGDIIDVRDIQNMMRRVSYDPDSHFMDNAYPYLTDYEFNVSSDVSQRNITALEVIFFQKAFSAYFTSAVSWFLRPEVDNKLIHEGYTRTFYQKYDRETLLNATEKIDNYALKDFFRSIIISASSFKLSKPYCRTVRETGENVYFMYCKLRKKIWIELEIAFRIMIRVVSFNRSNKYVKANSNYLEYTTKLIKAIMTYDYIETSSYFNRKEYNIFEVNSLTNDIIFKRFRLILSIYMNLTMSTNDRPIRTDIDYHDSYPYRNVGYEESSVMIRNLIDIIRRYNYIPTEICD